VSEGRAPGATHALPPAGASVGTPDLGRRERAIGSTGMISVYTPWSFAVPSHVRGKMLPETIGQQCPDCRDQPTTTWSLETEDRDSSGVYYYAKRVASAVGEGAMAVQFVHEYLKEM
jgi:hypothetical protein